jgi:hypothetical protein
MVAVAWDALYDTTLQDWPVTCRKATAEPDDQCSIPKVGGMSTFSATPVFIRAFCLTNSGYAILFLGTKQPGRESRLIPTYKTRSALHLSPPYAFIVLCLCTGQQRICSCFNFRGIWLNASPVRAFCTFVCATVSLLAGDKHNKCCTLGLAFFDAVL